ncbi:hypothetical protein QQF64_025828 [Cirrhinus molitorella]|uniref:AIG1-type G domain-containing protein n=1 Tax=Cirrhinus molitorella TaxID=172907 RepID=A0ABR3NQJ9_9TELE
MREGRSVKVIHGGAQENRNYREKDHRTIVHATSIPAAEQCWRLSEGKKERKRELPEHDIMTDPNRDDAMDTSAETDYGGEEQCDSDTSDSSRENIFPNLTIVLTGNSSSVQFGDGNILLGQKQPNIENAAISRIVPLQKNISEHHVSVINMIDLHETELNLDCVDHHIGQLLNENDIHAFIFVVRLGQLTDADKMGLEWLQRVFGDRVLQFVMILFTYETEEECDTIIDDLKKNCVLEQLLEKCGGRYQTCNKMMNDQSEMTDLMKKIECHDNNQQRYTREMFNTTSIKRQELGNSERGDLQDLRIVLLGVSGAGKSSIGNAILGREVFKESRTRESEIQRGRVEDRNISIINTPGFFNTHLTDEELQEQMMKSLDLCNPGPHMFLLVINLETFEEDERNIIEKIEEIFGVQALKFTMVLFTEREGMSKEKWKKIKLSEICQDLISKCRAQYHVFNLTSEVIQTQIKSLLKEIHEFIKQNDKQHFKNKIDTVSQTRSTKEKKKQEENYRKKKQNKFRRKQAMQETFEMSSAMEEGTTVCKPAEFRLRKKTTDVCKETVLQGIISLDRSLIFSNERIEEEYEVENQENSWKMGQKKHQTAKEKHPTQAGKIGFVALCLGLICVFPLVFQFSKSQEYVSGVGAERGVERADFGWREERIFKKSERRDFHSLRARSPIAPTQVLFLSTARNISAY